MLEVSAELVEETLDHLRAGGRLGTETVVLWLGSRADAAPLVTEVYRPDQVAALDFFRIPPEAMRRLLGYLRHRRLQVLAQCHSHPAQAFHSHADDRWAIVRHVGAFSLVVPWFASRTNVVSFLDDTATFQLDAADRWREVRSHTALRMTFDAGT